MKIVNYYRFLILYSPLSPFLSLESIIYALSSITIVIIIFCRAVVVLLFRHFFTGMILVYFFLETLFAIIIIVSPSLSPCLS